MNSPCVPPNSSSGFEVKTDPVKFAEVDETISCKL